jgi:hypothetical protein
MLAASRNTWPSLDEHGSRPDSSATTAADQSTNAIDDRSVLLSNSSTHSPTKSRRSNQPR